MSKTIPLQDTSSLKNELRKYRKGAKLTIPEFNKVARLAYLGYVVLNPLDPEDPDVDAYLVYIQPPEGLAGHILNVDPDLPDSIRIMDAEQGDALAQILQQGVQDRVDYYRSIDGADFYFEHFFESDQEQGSEGEDGSGQG
jgi:hypothetical protein